MPTQEMVLGTIRTILAAIGGYIVSTGVVDAELWVTISGAVLGLAALGWSLWNKRQTALVSQTAALPGVDKVVLTSQKEADADPSAKVVSAASQARGR